MSQITVTGEAGSLQQTIRSDQHTFLADEPASVPGGTDTGPDPYELLLAALGACTSMTLQMYAGRKKWPLERVEVALSHRRIHARDCETCESSDNSFIDLIEKHIAVTGDLDEEQLKRLGEIADRCPVHRTLMNEKQITTEIRLAP